LARTASSEYPDNSQNFFTLIQSSTAFSSSAAQSV
jgi:hypothetical protein